MHLGELAIASSRLVPSTTWRAAELDQELSRYRDQVPEATFHDAYIATHRHLTQRA